MFYLAAYTVTNLAAFAVTTALPALRDLKSYRGLGRAHPWLAAALVVALLGLVGTPPTAVFVGKLTTASAAWDGDYAWLAVVVLVNALIGLFYYLRWIVPAVSRDGPDGGGTIPGRWASATAIAAATASIALGIAAGSVWQLLRAG